MAADQLGGILFLATALVMGIFAMVLFTNAKRSAKRVMRLLADEAVGAEAEYSLMRATLAFLVAGFFFAFLSIWAIVRAANVEAWLAAFGA